MGELINMEIAGTGKIPGGTFGDVNISGMGKIVGDVKGKNLNVAGMGSAIKDINFDNINIAGTFKSSGIVSVNDKITINGTAKINAFEGNDIEVNGTATIAEGMKFNKATVNGRAKVAGDCEGNIFSCNGSISVGGLLSADRIDINLRGRCTAKDVGGEEITIKNDSCVTVKVLGISCEFWQLKKEFKCESIEGDKIYLENTICEIVRGENIVIGKGCKINKVEYYGTLKKEDGSIVIKEECLSKS